MKATKTILAFFSILFICLLTITVTANAPLNSGKLPASSKASFFENFQDTTNKKNKKDTATKITNKFEKVRDSLVDLENKKKAAVKLAKEKAEAAKKEAPKVPIFKKFLQLFKFKSNRDSAERTRVIGIFNNLGVDSSITTSDRNFMALLNALSFTENQHYDSLLTIVQEIKNGNYGRTVFMGEPQVIDNMNEGPKGGKQITDTDIEDLTNKLLPLIAEKTNAEEKDKIKSKKLAAQRAILSGPPIQQIAVKDSTKNLFRIYRLAIKNTKEIYGIYTAGNKNADIKTGFLNKLIYNSFFINGSIGSFKPANTSDIATNPLIRSARNSGCEIIVTASIQAPGSASEFLKNQSEQTRFIQQLYSYFSTDTLHGVNISFDGLTKADKPKLSSFIKNLHESFKGKYSLLLTIQDYQKNGAYDLKELAPNVDRFLVNFSAIDKAPLKIPPYGSMQPLKGGENSIDATVKRYLLENIPSDKLIVSIPYIGNKWKLNNGKAGSHLDSILSYSKINSEYDTNDVYYDKVSASAVIDVISPDSVLTGSIYFDDEVSLGEKYDYVINNSLGGISIHNLGEDDNKLLDVIYDKFCVIDSVLIKDSLISGPQPITGFWNKLKNYAVLWKFILNNPCKICFENIKDSATSIAVYEAMQNLHIDSIISVENMHLPRNLIYKSRYQYVNAKLSDYLLYISLFFLALILAVFAFYVYKINKESYDWAWRTQTQVVMFVLSLLLISFGFTWAFSDNDIPLFGTVSISSNNNNPIRGNNGDSVNGVSKNANKEAAYSKKTDSTVSQTIDSIYVSQDILAAMKKYAKEDTAFLNLIVEDKKRTFCQTDPDDICYDMPLYVLILIVTLGMLIGIFITWFLIVPIFKRKDIP